MSTLPQMLDATEQGLRQVYEKRPEERDNDLANRVLVLAWLAYDANQISGSGRAPNGRAAYHLALGLGAVGRYQEAVPFFEQAITTEPANADYQGDYAAALLWMDNLSTAGERIRKAQALDPSNGQFDYMYGCIILKEVGNGSYCGGGGGPVFGSCKLLEAKKCYEQAEEKLARDFPQRHENVVRFLQWTREALAGLETMLQKHYHTTGMIEPFF